MSDNNERKILRKQLLDNGYSPIPGLDKQCKFKNWNAVEYKPDIDAWPDRFTTTCVRVENGLLPIDGDVSDEGLSEILADTIDRIAPEVINNAPARFGSGRYKVTWFCRLADGEDLFVRRGSLKFSRPEDLETERAGGPKAPYHHVEIFGGKPWATGKCSRQFGCFGRHSENLDYTWAEGPTLLDVKLRDLPQLTSDQVWIIIEEFEKAAVAAGWEAHRNDRGHEGASHTVFDIDRKHTQFDTKDYGWLDYAELEDAVEQDGKVYLQATFIEGEKSDSYRCAAWPSEKYKCVMVQDFDTGAVHLPIDLEPPPGLGLEGLGPILEKLNAEHAAKEEAAVKERAAKATMAVPYQWIDPDKIPMRAWVYGRLLIREYISMTVAPGGIGKSSLIAVEALAQVSGLNLLGEKDTKKLRVWLWNLEDPLRETQRKLQAAALHYGLTPADIGDRLYVNSGCDTSLVIARMDEHGRPTIVEPIVDALVEEIIKLGIDVLVIDPFVSCHELSENDNTAQDMIVKRWGRVAQLGNCAVHLVDHARKAPLGVEVTTDSSRGAKAKTDAARVVRVVNRMSEAEGNAYGIRDPWRYFSTFHDKSNMAPPADFREWFFLDSVRLDNGGKLLPGVGSGASLGDSVGVVRMWAPPRMADAANGENFKATVLAMAGKRWRLDPRSPEWVGIAIAQGCNLMVQSTKDRKTIKVMLDTWLRAGLLKVVEQLDDKRRPRDYIEIVGGV